MKTLSVTGKIDDRGQLSLDRPIQDIPPSEVRVIIVFPDPESDRKKEQRWEEKMAEYKNRKLMPNEQFHREFKQAFIEAGYDSRKKVMQLIRDVKKEMADERSQEIRKIIAEKQTKETQKINE